MRVRGGGRAAFCAQGRIPKFSLRQESYICVILRLRRVTPPPPVVYSLSLSPLLLLLLAISRLCRGNVNLGGLQERCRRLAQAQGRVHQKVQLLPSPFALCPASKSFN